MTLNEWETKYELKAEKCNKLPGFSIYFEPDKGFMHWHVFKDIFEVNHTCTNDIQYFNKIANQMAKEHHCRIMRTATSRNPAAYLRLQKNGAKINISLSNIRPNGKFYWVFEREVKYD